MNSNEPLNEAPLSAGLHLAARSWQVARSPLKLAVITQFFPPDFAATGQLLEELAHQLSAQGVSVDVFTGQPGYAFQTATAPAVEQTERLHIRRSRTTQLFSQRIRGKALNGALFSLRAGLYLLRAGWQRDVLLLTTAPPFLPVLGYLAHLIFGIPYICLLYDLYPDIAIELGVVPYRHWLARLWRRVNQQIWQQAEAIIVLSPAMKQRIVSHCPPIADKISVIHSWADPDRITPIAKSDNWFAQKHDLVEPFTVLYSGNMGRCHDLETVLAAAIALRDEPVQFVCIGGGAKRQDFARRIQQLGLKNFLFLPYQDRHVLPYSLTACDLSLVSMSEGMEELVAPSKLYPALSAGRPVAVICPQQSYLNQLIADADCGATFRNGDGDGLTQFIRSLRGDRALTESLGNNGHQYLRKHFTPELIAQQYLGVLRRAISV